jgi:hypothetical protein
LTFKNVDNREKRKSIVDYEDCIIAGIEFLLRLTNTVAFKAVNAKLDDKLEECENHPFKSPDYWRCYIRYVGYSPNELVGTARMGSLDDNTTVVDSSLRYDMW